MLREPGIIETLLVDLPKHLAERTRTYSSDQSAHLSRGDILGSVAPVVYWTHHALRTVENPALDVARWLARKTSRPLFVYQGFSEGYRFASDRHHTFALQGAADLQRQYQELGISYALHIDRKGYRVPALKRIAQQAAILVTDDFPGEPTRDWLEHLRHQIASPIVLVDTACVVPMKLVGKSYDRAFAYREATASLYAERVGRDWPDGTSDVARYDATLPFEPVDLNETEIGSFVSQCDIDHAVGPVTDTIGGYAAGMERWNQFKLAGLKKYAAKRNDPCAGVASRMSAYLHYGMVSPFQLAREANALGAEKYLDELLIWRELAYCYCYYREDYQTVETLPAWAVSSLRQHESDARQELYSWESLARGKTSDRLWNACQRSLLKHGELHNNVRMTWGKRLLDWTTDASDCLRKLIDLNHRYALDGRDPASYGGILWCLGQFDRPFHPEQPVIGTVRSRPTAEHGTRINLDGFERIVDRSYCTESPKIALIGAGLGGSICARTLVDHGLSVQVFEKSRGSGGRAATRRIEKELQFDHGAQYFTCKDARIAKYVESWIQDQVVAPWRGKIAAVQNGTIVPETKSWDRFVGVPGMNAIGRRLMDAIPIQTQTRVQRVVHEGGGYRLFADSLSTGSSSNQVQDLGRFDCVLWNCPPEQTAPLVPEKCSWLAEAKRAAMMPTWTVMVAFTSKWSTPFDGAFINDKGPLRWLARNSSKPGRPKDLDCWTIHADSAWSADHLTLTGDEVAEILLEHLSKTALPPMPASLFRHAQRWLYASPRDRFPSDCAWDADTMLGACGDWFVHENVEGALLSGIALAGRVLGTLNNKNAAKRDKVADSSVKQLTLFD